MAYIPDSGDTEEFLKWAKKERERLGKGFRDISFKQNRFDELLQTIAKGTFDEDCHAIAKRVDSIEAQVRCGVFVDPTDNLEENLETVNYLRGYSSQNLKNQRKLMKSNQTINNKNKPFQNTTSVLPITSKKVLFYESVPKKRNKPKPIENFYLNKIEPVKVSKTRGADKLTTVKHFSNYKRRKKKPHTLVHTSNPVVSIPPITKELLPGVAISPDSTHNICNKNKSGPIICYKYESNEDFLENKSYNLVPNKVDGSSQTLSTISKHKPYQKNYTVEFNFKDASEIDRKGISYEFCDKETETDFEEQFDSLLLCNMLPQCLLDSFNVARFTNRLEQRMSELLPVVDDKVENFKNSDDIEKQANVLLHNLKGYKKISSGYDGKIVHKSKDKEHMREMLQEKVSLQHDDVFPTSDLPSAASEINMNDHYINLPKSSPEYPSSFVQSVSDCNSNSVFEPKQTNEQHENKILSTETSEHSEIITTSKNTTEYSKQSVESKVSDISMKNLNSKEVNKQLIENISLGKSAEISKEERVQSKCSELSNNVGLEETNQLLNENLKINTTSSEKQSKCKTNMESKLLYPTTERKGAGELNQTFELNEPMRHPSKQIEIKDSSTQCEGKIYFIEPNQISTRESAVNTNFKFISEIKNTEEHSSQPLTPDEMPSGLLSDDNSVVLREKLSSDGQVSIEDCQKDNVEDYNIDSINRETSSDLSASFHVERGDETVSEGEVYLEEIADSISHLELDTTSKMKTDQPIDHNDQFLKECTGTNPNITEESYSLESGMVPLSLEKNSCNDTTESFSHGQVEEDLSHITDNKDISELYIQNQELRRRLAFISGKFCRHFCGNE